MALTRAQISAIIAEAWTKRGSSAGLRDGISADDPMITGLTDSVAQGISEAAIEGIDGAISVEVDPATTASAGIVELATAAEVQAGADELRAVTPASLATGALNPLKSRVTAVEGDLSSLQAQVTTVGSDLSAVEGDLSMVETNLDILGMTASTQVGAALSAIGCHRVRMTSYGSNKLAVISAVRTLTGLGLVAAKQFVESVPVDVLVVADAATAQSALASLQAAGATATVIGGSASIDADLTVSGDVTVTGTLSAPSLLGDPETGNFHFNNSHLTGVMGLTMGVGGSIDGLQSLDVDYLTTGQELTANNYLTVNGDLEVNGPAVVNGALSTNSLATDSIAPKTEGSSVDLAGDLNVSGALSAGSFSGLPAATTAAAGIVELATYTEAATGTDQTRAVTPYSLTGRTATTARTGLVELATNTETQTGTDTSRAITPAALTARTATTSRTGLVELATSDEAKTGTDTSRAVTPSALRAALQSILIGTNATTTPIGSLRLVISNSALVSNQTYSIGATFAGSALSVVVLCVSANSTNNATLRVERSSYSLSGTWTLLTPIRPYTGTLYGIALAMRTA